MTQASRRVPLRLSGQVAPGVHVDSYGPVAAEGWFVRRSARQDVTTSAGADFMARSSHGRA